MTHTPTIILNMLYWRWGAFLAGVGVLEGCIPTVSNGDKDPKALNPINPRSQISYDKFVRPRGYSHHASGRQKAKAGRLWNHLRLIARPGGVPVI